MSKEDTLDNIVMSPEGVEERIEGEITFRTVLTQGGRYRIYVINDGNVKSSHVCKEGQDRKQADKEVGEQMMLLGALFSDPERTIKMLLKGSKDES